jgi:hypothetical protein
MREHTVNRQRYHLAIIGLCIGLSGCDKPDPLIGKWESRDRIAGERNELEIEDDLDGEALVFAYPSGGDTLYEFEFDVTVERTDDGEYDIDMECIGNCTELDFTMECQLDDDELECDATDLWETYDFRWQRQ